MFCRISEKLQRKELRFAVNGRAVVTDSPATCLLLIQDKVSKLQLPQLLNFSENKNSLIPSCTGASTLWLEYIINMKYLHR